MREEAEAATLRNFTWRVLFFQTDSAHTEMKGTDGMENRFSHLSIPYLAAWRPFEEDGDGL